MRIVETKEQAEELLSELRALPGPFGLDTETVGCDPRKESPVGKARCVCWSLSALDVDQGYGRNSRVFLWDSALPVFKDWLEDPTVGKVGHNIFTFDRHVFANHGINLQGIVGDTLRMSKLLNASKLMNHGLKDIMKAHLGLEPVGEFKELFGAAHGALAEAKDWDEERKQKLYDYATLDAYATLRLYHYLSSRLAERKHSSCGTMLEFNSRFWNPQLYVLNAAERNGILLDRESLETGRHNAERDVEKALGKLKSWVTGYERQKTDLAYQEELRRIEGLKTPRGRERATAKLKANPPQHVMNWESPKQVQELLYDVKCLPVPPVCGTIKAVKKTKRGKRPTDQAAIDWLINNTEGDSRDYLREYAKLKRATKLGQFLSSLPTHADRYGRIHCVLAPETDTGRLSCKCPNLQQIPRSDPYGIRRAFTAQSGHQLIVADYSQLELYVLAHFLRELFGDDGLARALEAGDVHSEVAKMAWPELQKFPGKLDVDLGTPAWAAKKRSDVKSVVYGLNYGKTARGLGIQIKDEDGRAIGTERAQELLDTVCDALGVKPYQEYIQAYAIKHGGVHTLLGRWRPLPGAQSDDEYERSSSLRQALNTPIQGSAADIVTAAMLRLNTDPLRELQAANWFHSELAILGTRLLLQVHDELVFEVPMQHAERARELVQWGMEHPFKEGFLKVPLKVEAKVCDNWAEGK